MVAFLDDSDERAETEISNWLTLDEMIVESLTTAPRQNFSLCLYIPFLAVPIGAEDCARSVFPGCSALGILSFLYYDDVEDANQTMKTRPVLVTEFIDMDPQQMMWSVTSFDIRTCKPCIHVHCLGLTRPCAVFWYGITVIREDGR